MVDFLEGLTKDQKVHLLECLMYEVNLSVFLPEFRTLVDVDIDSLREDGPSSLMVDIHEDKSWKRALPFIKRMLKSIDKGVLPSIEPETLHEVIRRIP